TFTQKSLSFLTNEQNLTNANFCVRSHFLTEKRLFITKTSFFIQSDDFTIISNTNSMDFS
ncbi:hypothetical protein CGH62_26050, partial [Vibrio parahaemolyticus]